MTITDQTCLNALDWMRRWDFSFTHDIGFLAMKLGVSNTLAAIILNRGREIEARKKGRCAA